MKAKLIKTGNDYLLKDTNGEVLAITNGVTEGKKLSKQNCDEIFGVVYVEKLADEYANVNGDYDEHYGHIGFKAGFKKAIELNKDKVFTLEDMRKAMDWIMTQHFEFHEQPSTGRREHYLQLLKQPIAIEVDIEMENKEYILTQNGEGFEDQTYRTWEKVPKLDSEGCLILKKI
jgi:hypothetical protein